MFNLSSSHRRIIAILLAPLLLFTPLVLADFTADWTSYSDSADLPMSEKWRSEMRDKLKKVDVDSLSPEQKERYKEMMFQLREDASAGSQGYGGGYGGSGGDDSPISVQTFGLILAVVAYFGYQKFQSQRGGAGMAVGGVGAGGVGAGGIVGGGGVMGGGSVGQTDAQREAMREARLRQFEQKPTSEPMPNPWA